MWSQKVKTVLNLPLLKNCYQFFAEVLPSFGKLFQILIEQVILKGSEYMSSGDTRDWSVTMSLKTQVLLHRAETFKKYSQSRYW